MKLFFDIVMKRIYLFNIVAWNYRKKIGFPVCKKENFTGLQEYRKRRKSARASPTPHHTLNEERSARFTAQPLSALVSRNTSPLDSDLSGGHTAIQRLNNLGLVFYSRNNEQYNPILFQGLSSISGRKALAEWLNRAIIMLRVGNFLTARFWYI